MSKDESRQRRFHNLRHTAVSRLIDAGVPLPKVAKIVGWAPGSYGANGGPIWTLQPRIAEGRSRNDQSRRISATGPGKSPGVERVRKNGR
jgi:hypothetical protein